MTNFTATKRILFWREFIAPSTFFIAFIKMLNEQFTYQTCAKLLFKCAEFEKATGFMSVSIFSEM